MNLVRLNSAVKGKQNGFFQKEEKEQRLILRLRRERAMHKKTWHMCQNYSHQERSLHRISHMNCRANWGCTSHCSLFPMCQVSSTVAGTSHVPFAFQDGQTSSQVTFIDISHFSFLFIYLFLLVFSFSVQIVRISWIHHCKSSCWRCCLSFTTHSSPGIKFLVLSWTHNMEHTASSRAPSLPLQRRSVHVNMECFKKKKSSQLESIQVGVNLWRMIFRTPSPNPLHLSSLNCISR